MTPITAEHLYEEALTLHRGGNLDAAENLYRKVLEALPDHFDSLRLLGMIESHRGNDAGAVAQLEAALKTRPNSSDVLNSLGNALRKLKRLEDAVASFDRAIALNPAYAKAFNNRGNALREMMRFPEALASYEQATVLDRNFADAFKNRGDALQELRRLEEAVASYDHAVELRPDFVEALNNCGTALYKLTRLDEALTRYDRAIALRAGFANAYVNRGMTALLLGRLQGGWKDLEWRWKASGLPGTHAVIDAPSWQGESLAGRSIAIWAEQGLGDVIQFSRYLPLLEQRGAKVVFLAPAKLVRLLRPLSSAIEIVDSIEGAARFDFQCAIMSVPFRFGTELQSIPSTVRYLSAERDLVGRWKKHLGGLHDFKIGIAWQGNPDGQLDRGRSIPLAEFFPLARVPGVRLISLQKMYGLDQLTRLPADANVEILPDGFDSGPDAFIDTAAVMASLDLIITSDTSIAHLAAAIGRPTWIALKQVPEWRWLIQREDSPWYPTMRLFRQETEGDWKSAFSNIEKALRVHILTKSPRLSKNL